MESSKNNDLFQNRQPYSWKVSFIGFFKTANLVCKSEVKTSKDERHMLLATSCIEIASSNTKECIIDIKWVEQLFFFCFRYISIASKSSKIASNVYLPHPALLLALIKTDLKITCYLTSGYLLLFVNNYCRPEHVIAWVGRESYWSNFYLSS